MLIFFVVCQVDSYHPDIAPCGRPLAHGSLFASALAAKNYSIHLEAFKKRQSINLGYNPDLKKVEMSLVIYV